MKHTLYAPRLRSALGLALMGLALGAAAETTDVGTPREQTLVVDKPDGTVASPKQMNPFLKSTLTNDGLNNLIYSPLWDVNTATGEMFPVIADKMPEKRDSTHTRYRIHLKKNLRWSDGKPFTADDVLFTTDLLTQNPKLTSRGYVPEMVKRMTKVDNYTIDVQTMRPEPRFVQLVGSIIYGSSFRIVPQHIWKDKDPLTFNNFPPVTLGPFVLDKLDDAGNWILWKRRDDWQHSDAGATFGKPGPAYVLFQNFGTEEKRLTAMQQNKLDILMDVSTDGFMALKKANPKVQAWSDSFPYGNMNDACARGMHFNTSKAPYDKWQTRWALALATDIVDVSMDTADGMLRFSALQVPPIDVLSKTYYKPMLPWLQNMALPDGYKPFDANATDRLMAALKAQKVPNLPSTPQAIKDIFGIGWWKHDPNQASKLLREIGFKKDSAGKWLLPDGTPWKISIDAPADSEVLSRQLAQATAKSWRQFGVDAQVNLIKSAALDSQYVGGKFTVASTWWPLSCAIVPDVFVNLEKLHQDQIGAANGPSPNNPERFSTPEISAMIDQLRETAPESAEVVPSWTKVIQATSYQMPIINMVGTTKFIPVNTTYWTNYPSAKNPYEGPWWWWTVFKYMLPKIQPAK